MIKMQIDTPKIEDILLNDEVLTERCASAVTKGGQGPMPEQWTSYAPR